MQPLSLEGQTFGRLTVLSRAHKNKQENWTWLCKCECGNQKILSGDSLRSGKGKSCGCLRLVVCAKMHAGNITHGDWIGGKPSAEIKIWCAIQQRCLNPKHRAYHRYGGRGIKICRRWRKFENFLADMGRRPPGIHGKRAKYTIDRMDNDKGYYKRNCKWATMKEQATHRLNPWIARRANGHG